MTITEMIAKLEALKAEHGDLEVGVWQYAGGDDRLYHVMPEVDEVRNLVAIEAYGRFGDFWR
jgi:hypothetical protein